MSCSSKELWRFRLNWCFLIATSILYSVSTAGISSSFHQFVTNPKTEATKNNGNQTQMELGLGESELFYSLLISGFNFGLMVGGISAGLLFKCIPQWYLWLMTLIYSLASDGWLIIISKLLSGYFLGSNLTLVFSNLSLSSVQYTEARKALGQKVDSKSALHLRDTLFAINGIAYSVGYFIGPGAAVIFAQFPSVNQFRVIGWYNVAWGLLLLLMLFIMFHGESRCNKTLGCKTIRCTSHGKRAKMGLLQIFIIISMLVVSMFEMFRFGILETLFNPVLSDSFGLNERDSTYIFLSFGFFHISGSIIQYVLQKVKLSNQLIGIIGIILTLAGYILLGDWQSIPYDPCTEYSPFHHPELSQNDSTVKQYLSTSLPPQSTAVPLQGLLQDIRFKTSAQLAFADGSTLSLNTFPSIKISCKRAKCQEEQGRKHDAFLSFTIDELGDTLLALDRQTAASSGESYLCSQLDLSVICVNVFRPSPSIPQFDSSASIESLQVLPQDLYWTARNNCMEANVTGHQCHWIPSSFLTNRDCEDCQPICRSLRQILTFPQFILGLGVLLLSNSLLWVVLITLLFYQLPQEFESILMGIRTTLNGLLRTISPLILDAMYEGMQKRTFLIMAVMVAAHLPFLVEFIVLYRHLGPRYQQQEYTEVKNSESDHEIEDNKTTNH